MLFLSSQLACAAIYLLLSGMMAAQAKRSRTALLLAASCLATALWASAGAVWGAAQTGPNGLLDLVRAGAWYGLTLHLYRRTVSDRAQARFYGVAGAAVLGAACLSAVSGQHGAAPAAVSLLSFGILLRLLLAVGELVLIENLYRGTAPELRWHVGLACVALGSIAFYDVALIADAVLAHQVSPAFVTGRALATVLVAPLFAVSAARNRDWNVRLHVSRTAAFHSATLMGSGVFLVSLGSLAQVADARWAPRSDWAGLFTILLLFSGLLLIAVLLVSTSTRHWLGRLVSDHFFTCRYDYRREWLRCLATLSQHDRSDLDALPRCAIRALADVVDSPAGLLLSGRPDAAGLAWTASWNMPPVAPLLPEHPLLQALSEGGCITLTPLLLAGSPLEGLRLRFAVPLPGRDKGLAGCILLAAPRGPLRIDNEVEALLGVLAQEVAARLAEQEALRAVMETRDLHEYGKRFAFVAHDIKNVAGQLRLLTANAEQHLADPEFQRDMLSTVDASVRKIANLLRRLDKVEQDAAPAPLSVSASVSLLPRIRAAGAASRCAELRVEPAGAGDWRASIGENELDAVLVHLLDNAAAARPGGVVRIALVQAGERLAIEISDEGPGMTAEFIRDSLFRPFRSNTAGGSGIGAFQARELLRRAGGDLLVLSRPGTGTTMRVLLPRAQAARRVAVEA